MPRQPLDDAAIEVLARHAQLELPPERRAAMGPALDGMLAMFDAMFEVEVGETPPANSYDPRWGEAK